MPRGMMALAAGAALLAGCVAPPLSDIHIEKHPFGTTPDGQTVDVYTLRNDKGAEARIMNYGGIVLSLRVPDRNGRSGDVVLGYDKLDDYVKNNPYFGALIGRYGNRIAGAKFTLDGTPTRWRPTTAPTACTADSRGLTSGSGAPSRASAPTARN